MNRTLLNPAAQRKIGILYESPHFAVLDKPSGVPCYGAADAIEAMLIPQKRGGPWLAHRLDQDTSGCLLIAKRKTPLVAVQKIWAQERSENIKKTYRALVLGAPASRTGKIETGIERIEHKKLWKMRTTDFDPKNPKKDVKKAITSYRVLQRADHPILDTVSLLELELLTGRTHQARVHCAHLGCPILFDPVYGSPLPDLKLKNPPRLALSAHALEIKLETETIKAVAEQPPLFTEILNAS